MKKIFNTAATAVLSVSLLKPAAVVAEDYKFIIGGDIAAAATAGSSSSVSEGKVSLVTDTLSSLSEGESLDGRFCTWFVSVGGALRSDSWRPYLVITVR